MAIPYNLNIPDAPNNPSDDQPKMRENTNSIDALVAVDHYTFSNAPYGQHKQVTLAGKNIPAAQIDPVSVIYSKSGIASSVAQLKYVTQNGTFPLSCIRAWATFNGNTAIGVVPLTQFSNVVSVTRSAAGTYDVVLTPNVTTGTTYGVFLAHSPGISDNAITISYTISGAATFQILTRVAGSGALQNCNLISFAVFQI